MNRVYLSPHFDDAIFSCGGLIWEQVQQGDNVQIWTICAGDIPPGDLSPFAESLHQRWQTGREAIAIRKSEDKRACERVGADFRHFNYPDCIYRRAPSVVVAEENDEDANDPAMTVNAVEGYLYQSDEELFGPINPLEAGLIQNLAHRLAELLPEQVELVCPLAIGGHVDHRLTRAAAESSGRRLWYYADVPYVLKDALPLEQLPLQGFTRRPFEITAAGTAAWVEAAAMYASQISTFWEDQADMQASLQAYQAQFDGVWLWEQP